MRDDGPSTIRGCAALQEALDKIGGQEGADSDIAKIIVEHQEPLQILVRFALNELSSTL